MVNAVSFELDIPQLDGISTTFTIQTGETIFVLGANGTGKSSLLQHLYKSHHPNARQISAHRQTWFPSNVNTLSSEQKRNTETNIKNADTQPTSRWRDDYSSQRASLAIYDLLEADNVRSRSITAAVDADDFELARQHSKKDAPIKIINGLLRLANVPIEITVSDNDKILASKNGSVPYSVAELSDGERNALLIAASVLTVPANTLIIIDEPERHLHRSIISPLLTLLFAKRQDCAFIISTHDVMLPLDTQNARTLLVRGCTYSGSIVASWDVDIISPESQIDDDLRRDILGGRRRILFVEGTEQSLDKPLYSLVFPNVSVIAKSNCRDVEHAVSGIRDASDFHWVHAFGIVDNDRREADDLKRLEAKGIYATSVYSVESIYYHPELQRRVVERLEFITGENASVRLANAKKAALEVIAPHGKRLSERTAEKAIREQFFQHLPTRKDISRGEPIRVDIDTKELVEAEHNQFQKAFDDGDLSLLIAQYPIRETQALDKIATNLGFQSRTQYESAVRKLLMDDPETLGFVKSLFGTLANDVNTA